MASLRAMVAFRCSLSEGGGDPDCRAIQRLSCSAKAGHPVRRGLSVQSLASLEYWIPAFAGMTTERDFAFSRRDAPEVFQGLHSQRGSRECRVHAAPAVSCANSAQKTHTSIQVQSEHSGIPCAMALRLMPCSPRRRIRLVTVVGELAADQARSGRLRLRST